MTIQALIDTRPVRDGRRPTVPTPPVMLGVRSRHGLAIVLRRDEQTSDGGVQLPLLAPALTGLRLRARSAGAEFILPNPSGGRGVYVTSWPVVTGFAAPTLHDSLLVGRLSACKRVDPPTVREAARWVAREGHAGTEAMRAALDVDSALRTAALRLGGQLLIGLARRAGFHRSEEAARCLSRDGFYQLADRLGWHGPELAEALRAVSAHYATVAVQPHADGAFMPDPGAGPDARFGAGRWGRLLLLMQRLRSALAEEQSAGHGTDGATIGRILLVLDQGLDRVARLLPEIESMHDNPMPLLEAWRDGQTEPSGWLAELEAATDGWARVCLLWFDTEPGRQRQTAIAEIAVLTRTVGHAETRQRFDLPGDPAGHLRLLLERNERLRARELMLDAGDA